MRLPSRLLRPELVWGMQADLQQINESLQTEITERKRMEDKLKKSIK